MASKPRFAYRLGWRSVRYVCPHLTRAQARVIADAAGPAFIACNINTAKRAAAAVAQMAQETDGFRTFAEYASGSAYEYRRDLGNFRRGDGRNYRGRGSIMCTGRFNYAAMSRRFHHDFIKHPADMAKPGWALKVGAAWWQANGCNQLADSGDFVALTRRINGGTTGLADRQAYHRRARRVSRFLIPKRRKP
jgi:putative chitinase